MNSLVICLLLCGAVVVAAQDDQKCKGDFQSFLACVKDARKKIPESEKEALKKQRRENVNSCFATAGCDAPDYDGDLKNKPPGMNMSPAVKECLKKRMIEKLGSKLNDCLSRKGVRNLNFSALAESAEGSGLGGEFHEHEDSAKEGIQGVFKAAINTAKAVDKCSKKKGGDPNSVKPLEQCLHDIKKSHRSRVCALIKPCEDKASPDCKKRGQEIRTAICQCKKEKEADMSQKLRTLADGKKKVGIPDIMKSAAGEQGIQDIMNQVDACYAENNETEPPIMKLARQALLGGGGQRPALQAAFSFDASTVVIMSDMIALDAQDSSECQACP